MNQGRSMMRGVNLLAFAALAMPVSEAVGQSVNAAPRSRRPGQSSDSPNRPTDADAAAINFVDSLFGSAVPADPAPKIASRALGVTPAQAARRPKWSARLARNPRADDGNPPDAL
ncbi:MAG TPA: hypothetical protein PKC18_12275, partial [Lacipirellulaceae bacterium]|nr:hypothetical protein [Lacipirellulaceae bacterium]